MTWTSPRTWVAAETVTAAIMNTHIRDNSNMLSDPWAAYTVSWTSSGTTPTLGNGALTGAQLVVGKWVRFRIFLDYGTTTNGGTGTWQFSLPATSVVGRGALGTSVCYDGSVLYPRIVFQNGTGTLVVADTTPARISGTVPFSWNSSSELNVMGEYEAA